MKMDKKQMEEISFAAGWNAIPGFQATSYRYASPDGGYRYDLPDYNEDPNSLKRDLIKINRKIEYLHGIASMANRAMLFSISMKTSKMENN